MERIELKHLAPYIPYGLNFKCTDILSGEFEILPLVKLHIDHESIEIGSIEYDIKDIGSEQVKPLLHPLDRLNTLTNENIQINEHTINLLLEEKHSVDYGLFNHFGGEIDLEIDGDPQCRYDPNKSISLNVVLTVLEELHKGHYDIYGLIDQGLAEPIELKPKTR